MKGFAIRRIAARSILSSAKRIRGQVLDEIIEQEAPLL